MQSRLPKFLKFTLGAAFLCLAFSTLPTHSASAAETQTIKASELKVLATYKLNPSTQGATVTEKYFIYTDWSCDSCTTYLIRCKRSKPSSCTTAASGKWQHASTVYYKWGSGDTTVAIVENGKGNYKNHCVNYKTGKSVDKCATIKPSGLGRASREDILQGYTKYGNWYLRGWGYLGWSSSPCELRLYKKNSSGKISLKKVFYLPKSGTKQVYEIEGVAVDGSNGNVIFTAKSQGKLKFLQVSSSVLNLDSSSSSSSDDSSDDGPVDTNVNTDLVRDETNTRDEQTVSTYDGSVETAFFGTLQDDNEGCGVYMVLSLILDILMVGIGVAAILGITIAGITYLTAGDNVAKTTKAKRRIYEIVIGLAAYSVLYAALNFLLPGGKFSINTTCQQLTEEEIAEREAARQAAAEARVNHTTTEKANNNSSSSSNNSSSSSSSNSSSSSSDTSGLTGAQKIAQTAKQLAWPSSKNSKNTNSFWTKPTKWSELKSKPPEAFQQAYDKVRKNHWKLYSRSYGNVTRIGASCDVFVGTVIAASGYDKVGFSHTSIRKTIRKHTTKWKVVKTASAGDICQKLGNGTGHIKIYLGNGKIAEASSGLASGNKRWGYIHKGNCNGYTIYHATK